MKRLINPGVVFLAVILLAGAGPCTAADFAGKLQRVDLRTVTLRGSGNQQMVLRVDSQDREKAASFIGKSVTVRFRTEKGEKRVVRFQSGSLATSGR